MDTMMHITRKKKILIGFLIVVVLFVPLVFMAFKQDQPSSATQQPISTNTPITTSESRTTQLLSPTTTPGTAVLYLQRRTPTSAAVVVDTHNKPVSAVQLAISFDPSILGNVSIKPGSFFNQALVLINKIDYSTGTIFYAAVVPPTARPQQGKGEVAFLTYNFAPGSINPTNLQFLPNTKITARGIDSSILKEASGLSIAAD
jgi:hypothetical protein